MRGKESYVIVYGGWIGEQMRSTIAKPDVLRLLIPDMADSIIHRFANSSSNIGAPGTGAADAASLSQHTLSCFLRLVKSPDVLAFFPPAATPAAVSSTPFRTTNKSVDGIFVSDNQYLLAGHVPLATTSFLKIYLGHSRANWRTLCKNHAKAKRELAQDRPRKLLFRLLNKVLPLWSKPRNTLGFCVPAPPPGDDLIPRPVTSDPLDDPAHRLPDTYQIYLSRERKEDSFAVPMKTSEAKEHFHLPKQQALRNSRIAKEEDMSDEECAAVDRRNEKNLRRRRRVGGKKSVDRCTSVVANCGIRADADGCRKIKRGGEKRESKPLERAREIYDSRQKLSAPVSAVDDNGPPCGVPLEGSTLVTMSRKLPRATQNSRFEDAQLITHNMVLTQKLSPMYCKLHARGPCRPESRDGVALQTQSASTKWFRV
uniref:Uncharacterized protein n=1 Tax=Vespula pensylvanica TaxID=30213 RepID=A0A834U450_VESPE|nr:hypothetical protein H0235_012135 [Vespula pensylvanica]